MTDFQLGNSFVLQGVGGSTSTSTYTTYWPVPATLADLAFRTAAIIQTLTSSSANDAGAGSGAQTVKITGVDANYNVVSEVVTMNGTTAVACLNSYLFVNELKVVTKGGTGWNEGIIYAGTGGGVGRPAVVDNAMAIAANISQAAIYCVPVGYTLFVTGATIHSSTTVAQTTTAQLYVKPYAASNAGIPYAVFEFGSNTYASGSAVVPMTAPLIFPEKTMLRFRYKNASGTAQGFGHLYCQLYPN